MKRLMALSTRFRSPAETTPGGATACARVGEVLAGGALGQHDGRSDRTRRSKNEAQRDLRRRAYRHSRRTGINQVQLRPARW